MSTFVHLHNHTDYSLLDGAGSIGKYVLRAKQMGMDALAITDHGNMFGAIEFYKECRKKGIRPIIGCEFYIAPEGRELRDPNRKYYHLILLAMTDRGYHNLMELNTVAWTEGFYSKPRIDTESLFEHSEDLICLSACIAGEVPQKFLTGRPEEAYETAKKYKEHFGDRYYIEIQRHGLEEEKKVFPCLVKLAKDLDIPLVATNDVHYVDREDSNAHDILLCIGTGRKKADEDRLRYAPEQFYLRSPEEMASLFDDYPEALENTVRIAERCKDFKINFPGPELPEVEVPESYGSTAEYIKALAWEGLERRYPGYENNPQQKEELEKRLSYELDVIIRMGFDSYYLIVRDYIWWAKSHGIPVGPGRGSGAGSLVAYCIDITNVDPLHYGLIFERFLNPERVSLPDFDVDFSHVRRQEIIDYVTEKYGKENVGQIATFSKLTAKAVLKDVARVLDIPFDESNAITKLITLEALPDKAKEKGYTSLLQYSLDTVPELAEVRSRGGIYEELFDVCLRLEDQTRHVGTHACGVVIGKRPLREYVPLYFDKKSGGISTQYTMTVLEECGLVKMDFLGLKTLTLLENTEKFVRRTNPDFSLEKIPFDDEKTYRMMASGDTEMVFQFESPGMQKNLKLLEPSRFEELDAMTSLYRPGPMQFIPQYIDSKQGRMPIVYPDESLKDLLKPTYGVIIYQEQVMKVAQIIAGYSMSEADTLRKIMGKKKKDLLPEQEKKFVEGAVAKGYTESHARELFEMLAPFGGYGFNKSHSVCYTVLSFRTAYMKCHFPVEFYAANLTNEIGTKNFTKYLQYVRAKGIKILSPDINNSDVFFNVVDGSIVYGLAGIKGVGEVTVSSILAERSANGPFKDFMDFLRRSDSKVLNSATLEGLINSGAFDRLGYNRPTLIYNCEDAVASVKSDREAQEVGQNMLFGEEEKGFTSFEMKLEPDYDLTEKLSLEKKYIGCYVSGHPLDRYRNEWEKLVRLNLGAPERFTCDVKFNIIGLVTEVRTVMTKNGSKMGHLVVEDYNGSTDITVFPLKWAVYEPVVQEGVVYGFRGVFKEYNHTVGFNADMIFPDIMQMKPLPVHKLFVELDTTDAGRKTVSGLKKLFGRHRGPVPVEFLLVRRVIADSDEVRREYNDEDPVVENIEEKRIAACPDFSVDASAELLQQIKELDGVEDVYAE